MPRRAARAAVLIGIDTGGTFTDFVCFEAGAVRVHKRPSTPDDPARAVLAGLRALLGRQPAPGAVITYGSTVATNAVLERTGARVALLTTAGFEDVLEIGRQTRPDLYALEPCKPAPLVPRRRRLGVAERLTCDGRAVLPLSRAALRAAVAAARRTRPQSIAICLLHAYANPAHERRLGRALRGLGQPVSLSHELIAEYREYERTSTTVMNAYVAPLMDRHLAELRRGVGRAGLRVLQSNGGATSVQTASHEAVRTLLSGPAGGAIGALAVAQRARIERVISFDMGGTSTDVSLLDGAIRQRTEWTIGELPVKIPAIDIHTVGAGGGSIAYRDAGGALKVGPESAGADPGPACYGRGERPTVTDADLLLGRLVCEAFLGGAMTLHADRARAALGRLARELGLQRERAAEGVVRVVNAAMERAIRRISVERGHDPRHYTLVAFGGAAGMHACELAAGLGMRRVLLPIHPGLLSAWGAATAALQRDYVQTVRLIDPHGRELARRIAPLVLRARRELRAEGAVRRDIEIDAALDVRYRGQSYELRVPLSPRYGADFHAAHRLQYGYADEQRSVEVVNLRVAATARLHASGDGLWSAAARRRFAVGGVRGETVGAPPPQPAPKRRQGAALHSHRLYWNGRWLRAQRCDRAALPRHQRVAGPLVITELSATAVVPPDWSARVLSSGDLLVER
jgi:N-methylhydantoinase A